MPELCKREDCGETVVGGYYGCCSERCSELYVLEEEIRLLESKDKTYHLRLRRNELLDRLPDEPHTKAEEEELLEIEETLDELFRLSDPDFRTSEAGAFIRKAAKLLKEKGALSI